MPSSKENQPGPTFRRVGSPPPGSRAKTTTKGKNGKKRNNSDALGSDDDVEEEAYQFSRRKKGAKSDRLIHHGRHFGRTVATFVNMGNLIDNGVARQEQMSAAGREVEDLNNIEAEEHELFIHLLRSVPGLEARLFSLNRTADELLYCAEMLSRGVNTARSDDVKSLKAAVIDFITPSGGILVPALPRNSKLGRGFHHDVTGRHLCPTDHDWDDGKVKEGLRTGAIAVNGLQWPRFLYASNKCNPDSMWEGLLRGRVLLQAYKHVFTSPSSVDGQSRATRSGNAQLHGMTAVTIPSIAYIATLVRFSLSDAGAFSRTDTTTDSERFYNTLIEFLEDPDEADYVEELLEWWNEKVFPRTSAYGDSSIPKTSALAKLQEERHKRAALRDVTNQEKEQQEKQPEGQPEEEQP